MTDDISIDVTGEPTDEAIDALAAWLISLADETDSVSLGGAA